MEKEVPEALMAPAPWDDSHIDIDPIVEYLMVLRAMSVHLFHASTQVLCDKV
jgi:hypothetical protein